MSDAKITRISKQLGETKTLFNKKQDTQTKKIPQEPLWFSKEDS